MSALARPPCERATRERTSLAMVREAIGKADWRPTAHADGETAEL